jgi:autotransporter strand-loop-strand O-heptosyltransferase
MATIKVHTSLIGETGYNIHSRNFFKSLSSLYKLQVRNFTIGKTWKGYNNDEPHNDEYYIDDTFKKILKEQTLNEPDGSRKEYPLYSSYENNGNPDVHIVLNETDHYYFYDEYDGKKIAYNVWETTLQPQHFFNKLKEFDQVWVPSKWQRDCTIAQGIPEYKVKVVPEGVDVEKYKPINNSIERKNNRPFQFLLVGRWDYRKSTKEIIDTFVNEFSEDENVELLLSVDNPFASDGMSSTEERLKKFGISHKGIKIVNHLSSEQYVDMLRNTDVFVSCARGEGWNLPLIEAMASGIPSIYSNWGGQLEFAEGKGIPVDIISEVPASSNNGERYYSWSSKAPGNFVEPNFDVLSKKMRDVFENYEMYKILALVDSKKIREIFTWENASKIASTYIDELVLDTDYQSNSAAIIMAHANTKERKGALKKCLESIKIPKILSSNYPVDSDIQELCDWVIYTKENPLLYSHEFEEYDYHYFYWNIDANGNKIIHPFNYEHGYAAYSLTKNGLDIAKKLGKEIVHIINYDYIISEKTIIDNENLLKNNDIVFYKEKHGDNRTVDAYCSAFISSKLDPIYSFFSKYKSKRDYYITKLKNFNILENNLFEHFENTSYKKIEKDISFLHENNTVNSIQVENINVRYTNDIKIHFVDGPYVEVVGNVEKKYKIEFIDNSDGTKVYTTTIKNNQWARTNRKWFTNWKVVVTSESGEYTEHDFDLENKRVLISFDSASLGDNIAWISQVEEFRKKHNCKVFVSTFHNNLFENAYPNLEFINPGSKVDNLYASFKIGVFLTNDGVDFSLNASDYRYVPLQKIASDILGLQYVEIKPKIKKMKKYEHKNPYICIAIHSTAQSKYWNNPTGWQELVDYVKSFGYDVYLLSKEEDGYMGNKQPDGVIKVNNKSLEEIGSILQNSKFFVGIGSGLSWYSWALNVPTILISGFSKPHQEMESDVIRVINKDVCNGCFGKHLFDRGDWNWCPEHKGTERQFECSKTITFDTIKPHIENLLKM